MEGSIKTEKVLVLCLYDAERHAEVETEDKDSFMSLLIVWGKREVEVYHTSLLLHIHSCCIQ